MSGSALAPASELLAFVFGKLPAHGDFISRGLDDATIEAADAVIAEALAIGMNHWDTAWDDLYVDTPVWRFMATPGVFGPWWTAGAFMASLDAVGRQYPVVAGFSCPTLGLLSQPAETAALLERAEAAAREALLTGQPVDALMAQLSAGPEFRPDHAPEAVFSTLVLGSLEASPTQPWSMWWVAGGGDEMRLVNQSALTGEFLSSLFRRAAPAAIAEPKAQQDVSPSQPAPEAPDVAAVRDIDPVAVVSSPDTGSASDVPRPT